METPFAGLMQQFQQIGENLDQIQVTGEAGTGMVKVTLNGNREVQRVQIEPGLLGEDIKLLEDLVAAAVNQALARLEQELKSKFLSNLGSLMPPLDGKPPSA